MKVLHLLTSGGIGGIETLCNEINNRSSWDNIFFFRKKNGIMYERILKSKSKVYTNEQEKKFSVKTFKQLVRICKEQEIEIINIHHEDVYLQLYYLLLQKVFRKKKFVWTIHSCFEEKYNLTSNTIKNTIIKYLLKKILKKSNLLISVSDAVKNSYSEYFKIDREKFITIYNGTDISDKEYIHKKTNKKIELLYVGRICEVKGIEILIKAINLIENKNDIHLSIVGDGIDKEKYEYLVKELKLENVIEFYGKKSNVYEYLTKSDIFIYPSIWEEAFGISIIEAMKVGLPVIATNKGGIPEIISNERDGFLIESMNENELAKKIKEVIELIQNNKISEIQKNAICTSKKFDINNTIKKLGTTYSKLIS